MAIIVDDSVFSTMKLAEEYMDGVRRAEIDLELKKLQREFENAEHYRDSNMNELRGGFAARRNGTDYYESDTDFARDMARRIEAIAHWGERIEIIQRKIFKFRLTHGE